LIEARGKKRTNESSPRTPRKAAVMARAPEVPREGFEMMPQSSHCFQRAPEMPLLAKRAEQQKVTGFEKPVRVSQDVEP
jgi:hypothetical protein